MARLTALVERMLELNRKKAEEHNSETLRRLESDITITDRQIDRLVCLRYNHIVIGQLSPGGMLACPFCGYARQPANHVSLGQRLIMQCSA